ncbi:MAG: phosphoglucosamine mutase [Clostridiales bacterium]|nr:phosphoglucosamine mutase [Clostridiales bacterium]MBR5975843.1 phosphoglucosamine mutase [Clostridiales bacterium]
MGKYFGTDGFRGKAGVVLTAEHAFKTGRFLGWYYSQKHATAGDNQTAKIVIGKDTRRSSYMFENALASGIVSSGADAYLLHVTTTPCVSYITRTEEFDCGVMVSASHNPYYDNGIKLMNFEGEKMDDDLQDEIEKYIDGEIEELPYASEDKIGKTVDYYSGRNRYIGYLVGLAKQSFEKHKVGLDCANGSSWMIGRAVFDALGAKTYVINNTPDGVNINTNCGSTHIEGLQKFVVGNKLDVGFAFDGDADRCLAVDENGNVVNGDKIMYICAKYMREKGELDNNTVVTTIMSNFGLYKALDEAGIAYEKTAVGDRYVYENMKENGHMIGGEQSGHVIFRRHAHTGDGVLTAIMLMGVLIDTNLPLSLLAKGCDMYPQVLKNVVVDDKDGTLADPAVQAQVDACTAELGDNGRVLLRKSGTEPVLRVMSEAGSIEECEKQVDAIIAAMEKSGHLVEVKK